MSDKQPRKAKWEIEIEQSEAVNLIGKYANIFTYVCLIPVILIPFFGFLIEKFFYQNYYVHFTFKGERNVQYLDLLPPDYIYLLHESFILFTCSFVSLAIIYCCVNYFYGKMKLELPFENKGYFTYQNTDLFVGIFYSYSWLTYMYFFSERRSNFSFMNYDFLWYFVGGFIIYSVIKVWKSKLKTKCIAVILFSILACTWSYRTMEAKHGSYDLDSIMAWSVYDITQNDNGVQIVSNKSTYNIPMKVRTNLTHEEDAYNSSINDYSTITIEDSYYQNISDFIDEYYKYDYDEEMDKEEQIDLVKNYQKCLDYMVKNFQSLSYANNEPYCGRKEGYSDYSLDSYHLISAYLKYVPTNLRRTIDSNSRVDSSSKKRINYSFLGYNSDTNYLQWR